MNQDINICPMLNAYPDSMGKCLADLVLILQTPQMKGAFSSAYILPSLYHTDLDRGFSVQDYGLEEKLATKHDLEALQQIGIDLKLDFILNHASVLSEQFQDLLSKGDDSQYKDFFIDWNQFWAGHGIMTDEGYIQPDPELIRSMFFRKPGLPILMVHFPDGSSRPYWNTFYQKVWVEDGQRKYLGQMDLNIRSPKVWQFYKQTLETLASYGAKIVRLDAFAYAPKEVGARNFLNTPGTWDLLKKVTEIAEPLGIVLLPEIHASYEEGTYRTIAEKGYMVYDFFFPGLLLDALETGSAESLASWTEEIIRKKMLTVNMLGCHDGIPLLDLKGIVPEDRIQQLINMLVERGGYVKDLHGAKNMYYQVNTTYYSALDESDKKLLFARAVQMFMPGKPQIWYLDLFAGKNDYEAMKKAGDGGHKEINRTNLSVDEVLRRLNMPVVQRQLGLLKMRSTYPVFCNEAEKSVKCQKNQLWISWKLKDQRAELMADFEDASFDISIIDGEKVLLHLENIG